VTYLLVGSIRGCRTMDRRRVATASASASTSTTPPSGGGFASSRVAATGRPWSSTMKSTPSGRSSAGSRTHTCGASGPSGSSSPNPSNENGSLLPSAAERVVSVDATGLLATELLRSATASFNLPTGASSVFPGRSLATLGTTPTRSFSSRLLSRASEPGHDAVSLRCLTAPAVALSALLDGECSGRVPLVGGRRPGPSGWVRRSLRSAKTRSLVDQ
jgi:hypothetical protein